MALPHPIPRRSPKLRRALALSLVAGLLAPIQPAFAQGDDAPAETAEAAEKEAAEVPEEQPGLPVPAWRPRTKLEQDLAIRYGDHHLAVVGDDLITRDEILGEMQSGRVEDPTANNPNVSPEEREQAIFLTALEQVIESRLKVQGGRNQGYEPEMVRSIRDRYFNRQVESWGGPTEATARIASMGMTPDEFRKFFEHRLLAQFWEDSVTGQSVGAGGRQFVDPFVRPGKLFARYRAYERDPNPRFNEIVGKKKQQTVLQRLLIDSSQQTSVAEAERLAEALRENIATGVLTFEQAYNEYANFRGDESFLRSSTENVVATLARIHPDLDLAEFVRDAPIDDVSPVARMEIKDFGPVFALYRLAERIEASEATPFLDLELQHSLRESIKDDEAQIRIARGLSELVQTTYVAPADIRNALLNRGRRQRQPRR